MGLIGPNGCGKTTLLNILADRELPDEGNVVATIPQGVAAMNDTEARSFLHYYLFTGDDPVRLISSLSYGERARLALANLVAQGSNLLFLDEPINRLDIPSRARFELALENYNGAVLAVVHDRYFIQHFASDVWQISDCQLSFG